VLLGSGFFLLASIALGIAAFIDAITADPTRVRIMPRVAWVILIVVFIGFAAVAWFVFGRPREGVPGVGAPKSGGLRGFGAATGGLRHPSAGGPNDAETSTGWQLGGAGGRTRSGPIAPDDDPEFLRSLGRPRRDESGEETPPK
jgi:hypothetical protein